MEAVLCDAGGAGAARRREGAGCAPCGARWRQEWRRMRKSNLRVVERRRPRASVGADRRSGRRGACGDASTAQFVAGGTWPAKQRARTRQELKKRGRLRVGLAGARPGALALGRRQRAAAGLYVRVRGPARAAGLCPVQPEAAASAAGNLLITLHATRALRGTTMTGQGPVSSQRHGHTAHAQAGPARRAAGTDGGSSLARVGVRIIALHVAAIHKLLNLCFDVRGRLTHALGRLGRR